jgi:hypothetical protein
VRSLVLAIAPVLALAVVASPAHATGNLTVNPIVQGAGSLTTTSYSCALTLPVTVEPKNSDAQACPSKTASPTLVDIGNGLSFFRPASVTLTATPAPGWKVMSWSSCPNQTSETTCHSSVSVFNPDLTTAPRAIFNEIIPVAIGANPGAFTSDTTPSFTASTSVAGATLKCRIDVGIVPCPGGSFTSTPLADGAHTFTVVGVHNTNESVTPAVFGFTVDTLAPDASFDASFGPGEGALQTATSETFKLVSSEPTGATFECSLDGAPFGGCDSTVSLTGLAPGAHSFLARTIDRAGNVDATAVRRTWTIAVPDADGDGFNANIDCNDGVAAVHPGANDAAGNGIDENCDGLDAVAGGGGGGAAAQGAARAPEQVIITVAFFSSATKTKTTFTTLQVKNIPFGATVTVTCKGKGCPSGLKGKGFTKKNAFGTVSLAKFIKKPLRAGDIITVLVSKPGAINAVKTIKLRPAKKPLISTKCQPPGAKAPVAC